MGNRIGVEGEGRNSLETSSGSFTDVYILANGVGGRK
jgi:hypothetical protein